MNQKFTKKELERLGCTEEEIKLVIEYQKKLPIIVDNDGIEKFCVYARDLHSQLKVGKHFTDWFSIRVKSYKFAENVDYSMVTPNGETKAFAEGGDTRSKNYYTSIDMAKQLSMIERSDIGNVARRYYILMEDLVKRNGEWWQIRNPEKANYIPMCAAISESIHRMCGRYGDDHDFRRDADFINIIATGSRAQSIKNYLGITPNAVTRDNLIADYNEKISFLQEQNILLLGMDMPIIQRVKMLIRFFDTKYPNAKPIQNYHNRDFMIKARENVIIELETR